jgi:hypothetical protein
MSTKLFGKHFFQQFQGPCGDLQFVGLFIVVLTIMQVYDKV